MTTRTWLLASVLLLSIPVAACSDDVGTGGSDGKYHPATNGTAVDEADACKSLHDAADKQGSTLSCTTTLQLCPDFVRTVTAQTCAQYDQGTVNGCAQYYAAATDCADLSKRIDDCAFEIIAGSANKGCP